MGSLLMTCDPVGTDGVEITVELMGLYLYIYMLTRNRGRMERTEIFVDAQRIMRSRFTGPAGG